MKIAYINTQNKIITKDTIIRASIKAGMQYVEMENEILIEGVYLLRIIEKEDICFNGFPILLSENNLDFKDCCYLENEFIIDSTPSFDGFKKSDYKKESKRVNKLVKTNQYYNRRKYR